MSFKINREIKACFCCDGLDDNNAMRGFPPAVTMQDASSKQVNNISNTSQPVVSPIVNNMDVNDALMNYYQVGPYPGGI